MACERRVARDWVRLAHCRGPTAYRGPEHDRHPKTVGGMKEGLPGDSGVVGWGRGDLEASGTAVGTEPCSLLGLCGSRPDHLQGDSWQVRADLRSFHGTRAHLSTGRRRAPGPGPSAHNAASSECPAWALQEGGRYGVSWGQYVPGTVCSGGQHAPGDGVHQGTVCATGWRAPVILT